MDIYTSSSTIDPKIQMQLNLLARLKKRDQGMSSIKYLQDQLSQANTDPDILFKDILDTIHNKKLPHETLLHFIVELDRQIYYGKIQNLATAMTINSLYNHLIQPLNAEAVFMFTRDTLNQRLTQFDELHKYDYNMLDNILAESIEHDNKYDRANFSQTIQAYRLIADCAPEHIMNSFYLIEDTYGGDANNIPKILLIKLNSMRQTIWARDLDPENNIFTLNVGTLMAPNQINLA